MNEFFQLLKKEHKTIMDILDQLEDTEEAKKREELFQKLKEELLPHMRAEESTFYEPLLAKKDTRDVALEGTEEHHASDLVFKELEKMPKDKDEWAAKLTVFKEMVEHHIKEEEGTMFTVTEIVLTDEKIQAIMKDFKAEKKKLQENLK
ncbi:MAG: hemerythrin domain-containing protein [Anaerolineales bacterium]|jgi:hypothetical protein|nr:hemerythrin domain-containing protein [Anaerolineales bacterium]